CRRPRRRWRRRRRGRLRRRLRRRLRWRRRRFHRAEARIVIGSLAGVLQGFVGPRNEREDRLESLTNAWLGGVTIPIRVVLLGERVIRLLDVAKLRATLDAE